MPNWARPVASCLNPSYTDKSWSSAAATHDFFMPHISREMP